MNGKSPLRQRLEQAFRRAMAEREEAWLQEVFVPPEGWEAWRRLHSLLLLAQPGTGRTALATLWSRHPSALVVRLSSRELATLAEAPQVQEWTFLAQVLLRWALERLVTLLVERVRQRQPPPEWVAAMVRPLWETYQKGLPLEAFLAQTFGLEDLVTQAVVAWMSSAPRANPVSGLSPLEGARYLLAVSRALGYESLWLVFDLPTGSPAGELSPLLRGLKRLASVLQWFDLPGWVFRFLVPEEMAVEFGETMAVLRRRMEVALLTWTPEKVQHLVERRLAWATEGRWTSVRDVVADEAFLAWLRQYGQGNPRAWLSLLWPFLQERLRRKRALREEEWRALARRYPPPLYLDLRRRRVWLGARPVDLNREEAWRLLAYLYEKRGQYCSREELYYLALEARERVPSRDDAQWAPLSTWRGRLDTALYRLRQALEPDPRQPLYIVARRGRGVMLRHATEILGLMPLAWEHERSANLV